MDNKKSSYDGTKITFRISEYKANQLKEIATNQNTTVSHIIRENIENIIRQESGKNDFYG